MLNLKFNNFKSVDELDLDTIPGFEKFTDGNNPLIYKDAIAELKPCDSKYIDIIADKDGVFIYDTGELVYSICLTELGTLSLVKEIDKMDIVHYEFLKQFNNEVA